MARKRFKPEQIVVILREIFDTLFEAKVLVERWRVEYNTKRPHSSLNYHPPAPETIEPKRPENAVVLS